MVGFTLENTSRTRCTQIHPCDDLKRIEEKLDYIIDKLESMDGIKGFGVNLAANIIGNMLDCGKR